MPGFPGRMPRLARSAAFPVLAALAALGVLAPASSAQDVRRKQEIVFAEIAAHTVGDAPFDIVAKATSGLAVTLEVVSGPAVLDGKSLKLTGEPGLVIVRASQQGNALFQPALDAERAFTVHARPSAPVIRSQPTGSNVGLGEPVLLAVEATGEPEPSFQWRKDGSAITGANGRRLSIAMAALADAGAYDVVVSNASGEVRSSVARVAVGKRHQAISFQPATAALAGQPVPLVASASSGLPVQFEVVSGAAFLSGNTLTSQGGLVVVRASQPGDSTFDAAEPVTQTFIFNPAPSNQHVP